jgi:hypothetical protein
MPWHRVRTDYDHHRDRRRRLTYRLDVSILLASAILISVIIFGFLPFFEHEPEHSSLVQWAPSHETPTHVTLVQELSAGAAILCVVYLAIALFLRSKA